VSAVAETYVWDDTLSPNENLFRMSPKAFVLNAQLRQIKDEHARIFSLLSRWVSGCEPEIIRNHAGAVIGLCRAGDPRQHLAVAYDPMCEGLPASTAARLSIY
jgi:uncharacterized Fe-S cluster-containing radical SAM superfamily protein